MASTVRSDVIIPEIFTPYLVEATTQRDAFLASGVVAPLEALNATEGGDFVNIPNWKANLAGDFEVLTDSTSLTVGNITADKQVGVILHRGRAFESRDLAGLAAGSDPMAAIGDKLGAYIANQRQKDLVQSLAGVFGSLNNNTNASAFFGLTIDSELADTPTVLSPRHVAEARALLGDAGDKLSVIVMHSKTFYDLYERRAIDYVDDTLVRGTSTTQSGGSIAGAYGSPQVPVYMGMRVVVSDDVETAGSGSTTEYGVYFMTAGSVASGEQAGINVETDRDILSKSSAMSVDLHYVYHPVGAKWNVTTVNPSRSDLATATNWAKVYETKNIGMVRATVVSNMD